MEGSGAKALWQVFPPRRLRTLELPGDNPQGKGPGANSDDTGGGNGYTIGYDHAGCVSADGKRIFGFPIGAKQHAVLFDAETAKPLLMMKSRTGKPSVDIGWELATYGGAECYFSPGGREIVRTSKARNYVFVQIWDVATGAALYPEEDATESTLPHVPRGIAWDGTGKYFAAYEPNRTLNIYDKAGGKLLAGFENQEIESDVMANPSFPMLLSPDRTRLLVGTILLDTKDLAILLELRARVQPNWETFVLSGTYSLAFWRAYRGSKNVRLSLRDQLLLWQLEQADRQRVNSSRP